MATFGKLTDGASSQLYSSDRKIVSSFAPASSGTVTAGTARMFAASAVAVPTRMIIYSDSAGAPANLLATSDETSWTSTTEIAVNFTFSGANQISITSGTPYWIGVIYDYTTASVSISRDNTASMTQSNNDTYSDGATATFGTVGVTAGPIDVYITYTPSGGTTGQMKVYNGTSFVAKPVKVWNGSAWVVKPLKRWDGSAWITTPY